MQKLRAKSQLPACVLSFLKFGEPGFVATDYGVQDVPLSLACHLKVDELSGWPVSQLPEGCSLRLHTSKGMLFARENLWSSMGMEDSVGKYISRDV